MDSLFEPEERIVPLHCIGSWIYTIEEAGKEIAKLDESCYAELVLKTLKEELKVEL